MSDENTPEYNEGYNDGWELGLTVASVGWVLIFLLVRYLNLF